MRCPWCRERDAGDERLCDQCVASLALTGYRFDAPPPELRDRPPPIAGPFYRGRVSASALGKFVRCPEQYRREYLKGEWGPVGAGMVVGNAIHGGLERYYRWQIMTGGAPDSETSDSMVDVAFEEERDDDVDWGERTPGDCKDRAIKVFRNYVARVAPLVVPQLVEQWFEVRVPGCPVDVVGKVDLVGYVPACNSDVSDALAYDDVIRAAIAQANPAVETPVLRSMQAKLDVKSSFKGASKSIDAGWQIQGRCYLLVDELPMAWHTLSLTWRGKDGVPIVRTCASDDVEDGALVMPRTSANFAAASELVRRLVAAIELYYEAYGPDDPWPSGAVSHVWACGLCHFKETDCVYWHGQPARWDIDIEEGVST
jgi:hypothetical protein